MPQISIDSEACKKDGLCAKTCMRGIFQQEEKATVPKIEDSEHCYVCGQCLAICQHGAISHSEFPEGSVKPVQSENVPGYDQIMELIRCRRSRRAFRDKAVDRADIEKILEAARFAPSGHNEQSTEFVALQDQKKIDKITSLTSDYIRKLAKDTGNPIARFFMRREMGKRGLATLTKLAPELTGLADLYENGTDWIVRKAPVLLFFCADSAGGNFANVNANLALHNAALAAETLGLGCFYTGFVVLASDREERIAKEIDLPKTHQIYGALAIGYSNLKYKNWPERKPARVQWIGFVS